MKKLLITIFAITLSLSINVFAQNSQTAEQKEKKEIWNIIQGSGAWRGEWIKTSGRAGETEYFDATMTSTRGSGVFTAKVEVERRGDLITAKQTIHSSGTRCYFIGKITDKVIRGTVQLCTENPIIEYQWSAYITN